MRIKKLMRQYGALFFGTYFLAFTVLVTFKDKIAFGHVPGDILIGSFYLPIVSSLAVAAFVTIMLEFYRFTK